MKRCYLSKRFTPLALQIIDLAIKEAKNGNHTYVGVCHFQKALDKVKSKHDSKLFEV